jgi:hypothetical protein
VTRPPFRQPLVPGERCPATRTGKYSDPAVTITGATRTSRTGRRKCGKCGRPDVVVTQSSGEHTSAWYYTQHTVPEKRS